MDTPIYSISEVLAALKKSNVPVIQAWRAISKIYRGVPRQPAFVFHAKQVDIAANVSPEPESTSIQTDIANIRSFVIYFIRICFAFDKYSIRVQM